jgi:putative intracellular protease/amidase
MKRWVRFSALGVAGVAAVGLIGFAGWLATLPSPRAPREPPAIPAAEAAATLADLKPPKRARPLVAIIGINDGSETTDSLLPYGVLRRADVADVMLVSTRPGPVQLYPAFRVSPDATTAAFDAAHPRGADYVIVPAMVRDDDPQALAWIRGQAEKGAKIIGVCAGAKVVAAAGLLDGRRATTHWFYLGKLRRDHPTLRYVADRRFVADGPVVTTTGVTASIPMTLTLVEAIAGRAKAQAVAREIGLAAWDARHDSGAFAFTRPFALTVLTQTLGVWDRGSYAIELAPGLDEVSLALAADAWSRTYRSRVTTYAATAGGVVTRQGARILPDVVGAPDASATRLSRAGREPAARMLDDALAGIAARYGRPTARAVAMQLEYPMR